MNDRIEKQIELAAPASRVWRALTDHHEFGEWFRVRLEAPFAPGRQSTGHITYPGYEHIRWHSVVQEMVPERLFPFPWHPYAIEPGVDDSDDPPPLAGFRLAPLAAGPALTVPRSRFCRSPANRRDAALPTH